MAAVVNATKLPPPTSQTRYRVGVWVLIAAIAMFFTALTSAYIVRAGAAADWRPLALPRILWLSTILIIVSSGTIQAAARSLKHSFQRQYVKWLSLTTLLGLGFLTSQWIAWKQLAQQGVFLASSPNSSFFYLLTATHGLHLLVGLLALFFLLLRAHRSSSDEVIAARRLARVGAVATYWHFMDALWIYLFLLLFLWRSQ